MEARETYGLEEVQIGIRQTGENYGQKRMGNFGDDVRKLQRREEICDEVMDKVKDVMGGVRDAFVDLLYPGKLRTDHEDEIEMGAFNGIKIARGEYGGGFLMGESVMSMVLRQGWNASQANLGISEVGETAKTNDSRVINASQDDITVENEGFRYDSEGDPETQRNITQLLQNINSTRSIDTKNRRDTPKKLKFPLYEYQKIGLSWLIKMEEGSNRGGILADEMGLGKTIQMIALILSRPSNEIEQKVTLVVAPVSLLRQWKSEMDRLLSPQHRLRIAILHGPQKAKRTFAQLRRYDVVLTTYAQLGVSYKRFTQSNGGHASNVSPLYGEDAKFYRIILDEAQNIKNPRALCTVAACQLEAKYRFCVTGTPMMNSIAEMYSLLHFLRIRPYNDWRKFHGDFLTGNRFIRDAESMTKFQALLSAVLLRRTKQTRVDGKLICQNLPPRNIVQVKAVFSEWEEKFYSLLERKTQRTVNRFINNGTIGKNYAQSLILLLRLRQACCHPQLIKEEGGIWDKDLRANARQLNEEVVQRVLDQSELKGELGCLACGESVVNPVIISGCGHFVCLACIACEGGVQVCPSCGVKVDEERITDYRSFCRLHRREALGWDVGYSGSEERNESSLEWTSDSILETDSSSQGGIVVRKSASESPGSKSESDSDVPNAGKKRRRQSQLCTGRDEGRRIKEVSKKQWLQGLSVAELAVEAHKSTRAKQVYLKRLHRTWQSSAKICATLRIIERVAYGDGIREKVIIFSQFTALLDLLEVGLARKKFTWVRYDGSMTSGRRCQVIERFSSDAECKILLISLKAGNSGLNLAMASQVILLDPFWNPFIEEQAIDRAHRIGQLRTVTVHRILVPNTVEDRIVTLQETKRAQIETALDEQGAANVSRLGVQDLAYLFGLTKTRSYAKVG